MIEARNLVKHYGPIRAVDDVSFAVKKGEVLGFLGPNGAGKTTTMRLVTGYVQPGSGSVSIGGHDLEKQPIQAKSLIGYLPENAPLYGEMKVGAFLRFAAALRGLRGKDRFAAVDKMVEVCHLEPVRQQPIETLSKGYRQRTCFAQALLHDPEVLIMDEPTDGLDPNQKHEVRNLIKHMGENKAIVISTHILEEVDAVCSRVAIINQGKLIFDGLPDELRAKSQSSGAVRLTVHGQKKQDIVTRMKEVTGVGKVKVLAEAKDKVTVRVHHKGQGQELAGRLHAACTRSKWQLSELHCEEGRLDEVFRELTTGKGGGK